MTNPIVSNFITYVRSSNYDQANSILKTITTTTSALKNNNTNIQTHHQILTTLRLLCDAIIDLTSVHTNFTKAYENSYHLTNHGLSKFPLWILKTYKQNVQLVSCASIALCSLSKGERNRENIGTQGGIQILINVLDYYYYSSSSSSSSSSSLSKNLTCLSSQYVMNDIFIALSTICMGNIDNISRAIEKNTHILTSKLINDIVELLDNPKMDCNQKRGKQKGLNLLLENTLTFLGVLAICGPDYPDEAFVIKAVLKVLKLSSKKIPSQVVVAGLGVIGNVGDTWEKDGNGFGVVEETICVIVHVWKKFFMDYHVSLTACWAIFALCGGKTEKMTVGNEEKRLIRVLVRKCKRLGMAFSALEAVGGLACVKEEEKSQDLVKEQGEQQTCQVVLGKRKRDNEKDMIIRPFSPKRSNRAVFKKYDLRTHAKNTPASHPSDENWMALREKAKSRWQSPAAVTETDIFQVTPQDVAQYDAYEPDGNDEMSSEEEQMEVIVISDDGDDVPFALQKTQAPFQKEVRQVPRGKKRVARRLFDAGSRAEVGTSHKRGDLRQAASLRRSKRLAKKLGSKS